MAEDQLRRPIPILAFHSVTDQPIPGLESWTVAPAQFAEHLDVILEEGCSPLTVSALVSAIGGAGELPERPVVVSFDDGYADFLAAAEQMAARGLVSTLYVTTGPLVGSRTVRLPSAPMLSAEQLAPLEEMGVEIGAHSHHHHHVDVAPRSVALDEITRPKAILEDLLGHPIASYAYPFGSYRSTTRQQVHAAGYSSAAAVRNAFSSEDDNPLSLARLAVRSFTPSDTLRGWLEGRGAPIARDREHLRTTLWRLRRWAGAGAARRQARGG
jgi:peptidoglycan/xylan/chitin deacetylase (PgdA/CDA1 family)